MELMSEIGVIMSDHITSLLGPYSVWVLILDAADARLGITDGGWG